MKAHQFLLPLGLWRRNRCVLVQLCSTCSCWESELWGDSSMPCPGWQAGVSLLGLVLTLHLSRLQSELRVSSYAITVVHFNSLGLNVMVFAKSGSFFPPLFPLTSLASEISAVCERVELLVSAFLVADVRVIASWCILLLNNQQVRKEKAEPENKVVTQWILSGSLGAEGKDLSDLGKLRCQQKQFQQTFIITL